MKKLVICCDGTWNSPRKNARSNVWKMSQALTKSDEQVVYYDEGIGSNGSFIKRLFAGATGLGLSRNIIEAYTWLIHNFEEDDKIYVFGFSRGAFTVRSLAGMIRKCGILKPENIGLVSNAYALYRDPQRDPYSNAAKSFRNEFSTTWNVRLIGVFDTVGTFGVPLTMLSRLNAKKHRFHDLSLSRRIKFGYHAVALDEQRRHFKPTLWENQTAAGQTVEQVWFSGSHSNIGGGVANAGLSDITLQWMIQKAENAGLAFCPTELSPNCCAPITDSRHGLYKFYPPYHRPVCETQNHTESIHESVNQRISQLPEYHPVQLEKL